MLSVYLPLYGTETEKKTAIGLSSINQTQYHVVTVDLLLSYDMELDRNSYICLHIYIYGLILHYDMNLYFTKYRYCSKPHVVWLAEHCNFLIHTYTIVLKANSCSQAHSTEGLQNPLFETEVKINITVLCIL